MLKETIIDIQRKYTLPQQLTSIITGFTALFVILLLVLVSSYISKTNNSHLEGMANAIGKQVSHQATEFILTKDLISLSVICSKVTESEAIAGIRILDANRDTLARAGSGRGEDADVFLFPIKFNDIETVGFVNIEVNRGYSALDASKIIIACLLLGVTFFLVVAFSTWWISSFHFEKPLIPVPASPPLPNNEAGEEEPEPTIQKGPVLLLGIANYQSISSRVAMSVVDELFRQYLDSANQAALFYGGTVDCPGDHRIEIQFSGNDRGKAYFNAVCCASLFLGLLGRLNGERKSKQKITFDFHMCLLNPQQLQAEKWNICNRSPVNQLLIFSDDAQQNGVIDKILLESTQAEKIDTAEGALGAFTLSRLVEQYQKLIDNQVSQLARSGQAC